MCERHSIELRLTTNVQFLDERSSRSCRDITETLFLSIDSHIPELFEKIRPGSKPGRCSRTSHDGGAGSASAVSSASRTSCS